MASGYAMERPSGTATATLATPFIANPNQEAIRG